MTPLPPSLDTSIAATSPGRTVLILVHRTCGHIGFLVNRTDPGSRERAERLHRALEAGGYFQWRVRTAKLDQLPDSALASLVEGPCDTCRCDPARLEVAAANLLSGGTS